MSDDQIEAIKARFNGVYPGALRQSYWDLVEEVKATCDRTANQYSEAALLALRQRAEAAEAERDQALAELADSWEAIGYQNEKKVSLPEQISSLWREVEETHAMTSERDRMREALEGIAACSHQTNIRCHARAALEPRS